MAAARQQMLSSVSSMHPFSAISNANASFVGLSTWHSFTIATQ